MVPDEHAAATTLEAQRLQALLGKVRDGSIPLWFPVCRESTEAGANIRWRQAESARRRADVPGKPLTEANIHQSLSRQETPADGLPFVHAFGAVSLGPSCSRNAPESTLSVEFVSQWVWVP